MFSFSQNLIKSGTKSCLFAVVEEKGHFISPGGLDLSQHGLDRRFSKIDLDMMDILDGF